MTEHDSLISGRAYGVLLASPAEGSRMQLKCSKCSQPIALNDIIESTDGRLSHVDCMRPSNLTSAERQLIYVYCFDHVVAECLACNVTYRWQQLSADATTGRTNMCPRCRQDLTDSIRAHLYGCAMAPPEVRRRARKVRQAARRLVKESQQLRDTSDVILRQLEAALFERQQALRDVMQKKASPASSD